MAVWAEEHRGSAGNPLASLSQTLGPFSRLQDLWASNVGKVRHLSAGESAEHALVI